MRLKQLLSPHSISVSCFEQININLFVAMMFNNAVEGQMRAGSSHSLNQGSNNPIYQSEICKIQSNHTCFLNMNDHKCIYCAHLSQPLQQKLQAVISPRYRRDQHLALLIPVGPQDLSDQSIAGQDQIVRRLMRSLRGERTRGKAGHWSYDLNRHIGLVRALRAERARLRHMLAGDVRQNKSRPS